MKTASDIAFERGWQAGRRMAQDGYRIQPADEMLVYEDESQFWEGFKLATERYEGFGYGPVFEREDDQ